MGKKCARKPDVLPGSHYRSHTRRTEMIDEKKLIEKIKNAMKEDLFNGYTPDAVLHEVYRMISDTPKQGEWIPCSEKLPENDYDTVMVFLDSKIYDIAIWHNEHGFRPWYAAHFEASPPEWKACVTAWMPLPEPWKGDLK